MEKSYGKVNGSIDRVVVTCFEINFLIESVCRTDVYFQYIQTAEVICSLEESTDDTLLFSQKASIS